MHLLLERLVGRETMPGVHGFCSLPLFTANCRLRSEFRLTGITWLRICQQEAGFVPANVSLCVAYSGHYRYSTFGEHLG